LLQSLTGWSSLPVRHQIGNMSACRPIGFRMKGYQCKRQNISIFKVFELKSYQAAYVHNEVQIHYSGASRRRSANLNNALVPWRTLPAWTWNIYFLEKDINVFFCRILPKRCNLHRS
jgi:hypothetical protein